MLSPESRFGKVYFQVDQPIIPISRKEGTFLPPTELTEEQKEYIDFLARCGVFGMGEKEIKSGAKSPYYLSFRPEAVKEGMYEELLYHSAIVQKDMLANDLKQGKFQHCIGLPKTGHKIAQVFSQMTGVNLLEMEKVGEGKERRILPEVKGKYSSGESVLIIDDVISEGLTKDEGIKGVENSGLVIACVCIIVDREQGGFNRLARKYDIRSYLKGMQVAARCLETGVINSSQYKKIEEFTNSFIET